MRGCVKNVIIVVAFVLGAQSMSAQNVFNNVFNSKLGFRDQTKSNEKVLESVQDDKQKASGDTTDSTLDISEQTNSNNTADENTQTDTKTTSSSIASNTEQMDSNQSTQNTNSNNSQKSSGNIYNSKLYITQPTNSDENIKKEESVAKEPILDKEYEAEVNDDVVVKDVIYTNMPTYNTSNKLGIEFVPNIYCGFSNFTSANLKTNGTIGCGVDFAFQFIAKDKISFIPKNYFAEASIGYTLRGASSYPMHYINLKVLPFGYKYDFNTFNLFAKLGVYTGFPLSSIETFDSNVDFGMAFCIGAEYKKFGLGISYEQGFTNVCRPKLGLSNSCVLLNFSYRLFSFK